MFLPQTKQQLAELLHPVKEEHPWREEKESSVLKDKRQMLLKCEPTLLFLENAIIINFITLDSSYIHYSLNYL